MRCRFSTNSFEKNFPLHRNAIPTTVALNLTWTDTLTGRQATPSPTLTIVGNGPAAGNSISGSIPIITAASSSISYTTTYTAGAGCMTLPKYGVFAWVEAM